MKNHLFLLLFTVAVFCGCTGSESDASIKMVHTSEKNMKISGEGGKARFAFASALDWYVEVQDKWIRVTPEKGGPGSATITIEVDKNMENEVRQAIVNVCSEDIVFPVTITQDAYKTTFEILDGNRSISCLGGELTLYVNTDMDYSYSIDSDWITSPGTKSPFVRSHRFIVEPNPLEEPRTAVVYFDAGENSQSVTITQRPAGTEADDWQFDTFVHRSLAMRFTADWCGYCPYMAHAFKAAKSQMNNGLELLSLHGDDSSYEFEGTTALASRFHVTNYPTGIIDSRASIPNYASTSFTTEVAVAVIKETADNYATYSGITCSSELTGSTLDVDVSLYLKKGGEYRFVMLLLEDNIIGYQSGIGSTYDHDDVARLAITSMTGDTIQTDGPVIWTNSYTAQLSDKWNKDNLRILMYVEKTYGDHSKVRGVEGAEYGAFGNYYIDNCRSVEVGTEAGLELL